MQVIVIGGGAAGLMAAIAAAGEGATVTVLEQNDMPGRKLLATGNGKCNLTNVNQDPDCYRGCDPAFAWKVISAFNLKDTLLFFNNIGIYTRNRGGGLYPYSEQAHAVRDVLRMEAAHRRVKLKTRERVVRIRKEQMNFLVETETYTYRADRVILATGGPASTVTGSCDDGYRLAEQLGHRVEDPLPALCGLRGVGNFFPKWAGVRFETQVTLYLDDSPLRSERGEVQFTDYGLSGIPVFQLSRYAVRAKAEGCQVLMVLDFMPDLDHEQLLILLEERLEQCPYKSLAESLVGLLPQKLTALMCTEIASLSELAAKLKEFPVMIKGAYSMEQAQVASGGILTEQIDPNTMESLLIPGLYFAGEVVDVDGACGGYNLQWAWSSGAVAGIHSAKK